MLNKASDLMDKNFWTLQFFLGFVIFLTEMLEEDTAIGGTSWVVMLIGLLGNEVRKIKGKG